MSRRGQTAHALITDAGRGRPSPSSARWAGSGAGDRADSDPAPGLRSRFATDRLLYPRPTDHPMTWSRPSGRWRRGIDLVVRSRTSSSADRRKRVNACRSRPWRPDHAVSPPRTTSPPRCTRGAIGFRSADPDCDAARIGGAAELGYPVVVSRRSRQYCPTGRSAPTRRICRRCPVCAADSPRSRAETGSSSDGRGRGRRRRAVLDPRPPPRLPPAVSARCRPGWASSAA